LQYAKKKQLGAFYNPQKSYIRK